MQVNNKIINISKAPSPLAFQLFLLRFPTFTKDKPSQKQTATSTFPNSLHADVKGHSLKYHGVEIWNPLSTELRNQSFKSFKINMKNHLLDNY